MCIREWEMLIFGKFCVRIKWIIPNGSVNYDDHGGNHNNSNNASVARTIVNERSELFRPYTSGHGSRRRNITIAKFHS